MSKNECVFFVEMRDGGKRVGKDGLIGWDLDDKERWIIFGLFLEIFVV